MAAAGLRDRPRNVPVVRMLLEESYDARPLASGIRAWWSLGFACDNGQRTASTDAFASREKGAE